MEVVFLKCESTVFCFRLQITAWGHAVVFKAARDTGMKIENYAEWKETYLLYCSLYRLFGNQNVLKGTVYNDWK